MTTGTHYIGSKISLISKAEIRYEGILYQVDTKEATVTLAKGKLAESLGFILNVQPPVRGHIKLKTALAIVLIGEVFNFFLPEQRLCTLSLSLSLSLSLLPPSLPPSLPLSLPVRSFGTEGRPAPKVIPPRNETYEFIIFRGSDIKDLHVSEMPKTSSEEDATPQDPAILSAVSVYVQ